MTASVRYCPAPFAKQGKVSVEEELKRRRADLLGEIERFALRIETIRKRVSDIDQVIAIYDLAHAQNATSSMGHKEPRQAPPLPPDLKRLNKIEAILDALREAGEPLSSSDSTGRSALKHGVAADDPPLPRFVMDVSAALSALVKRKPVRQVGAVGGGKHLWEIAS